MIDTSKLRPWGEQYGINRTGQTDQTGQFGLIEKPTNEQVIPPGNDYAEGAPPVYRYPSQGVSGNVGINPWTATPTGETQNAGQGDAYSSDFLKNLAAVYAKNWGGQQGTEQAWYRTPEWAGGVVWNPYWGWQSGSNIKSQYSGGPLSSEQFYGMGLTRNPGEDWMQYYQQLTGMTPEQGKAKQQANYGGTTTTGSTGMTTGTPASYGYDFSSYFPEYGQATTLQLPQELDWASSALGELSATGRPADWAPWYQQAKGVAQTDIMDAIKQAAEQAGLSGTRWSTPMGRTAQDISGRRMQELGTEYTQQQLGAMENAANRSLTAAQGLGNIAQQRWNMPLQYASQAMGMGQNMQQQYQNMFNPQYQEFLRTAAENNPWLNAALGATSLTGQYTPQTYQQSGLSQGLGAGVDIASILAMLKFAGLLSSVDYKTDIRPVTTEDEEAMYHALKDTPLYQYRYKFEPKEQSPHMGMITETSPTEVTLFNKLVGLYEYIGALHATVKTLIRKIEEK